jgi:hypothetical protein
MLLTLHPNWWDDWKLYHKVTFDGINRLIIINPNETSISIKTDVYSAWKEWVRLRDNGKFLPSLRVTGGDPTSQGEFSGDIYFLINNWKILIGHSCNIDGVIYSDDFPSPFIQVENTQLVTNKVSSLVQTVAPVVNITGIDVPTANDIASAVWNAMERTLTTDNLTAADVWNYLLSTPTVPGSTGEKLKQVLTTGNFIALK